MISATTRADSSGLRMPAVSLAPSSVPPMQDLRHAMELSVETDAKAECHTERGMTYQKMHDFARAVKDLKQVCKLNSPPQNMQFADMPRRLGPRCQSCSQHAAMLLSLQYACSPHACITIWSYSFGMVA